MENDVNSRLLEYNSIYKENDDIYREAAKRLGMSDCSLWILYVLRTQERPPTQSELCGQLFMPKQTINSALKKLQTDGLIELRSGNDRKSKYIVMTEKGIEHASGSADMLLKAERNALGGMTDQEQRDFLRLFRKLVTLLRNETDRLIRPYSCQAPESNPRSRS